MRRRKEKEEPPRSNLNNRQPFEHAQKIQALNTKWKKKDKNTKGNRHVRWKTSEFTSKKRGGHYEGRQRWTQETRRVGQERRKGKAKKKVFFVPSVVSRVTATVSDSSFFHCSTPIYRNLPNQIKCFRRLLHAGLFLVEVHEQKDDAAQDLQFYKNFNGADVQVGLHCTIKGNYCAMIQNPLSCEYAALHGGRQVEGAHRQCGVHNLSGQPREARKR